MFQPLPHSCTLDIIYKEHHYSWPELSQIMSELIPEPSGILSAQQPFSSVLNLLHGFTAKSAVFPLSDEQINNKLLVSSFSQCDEEIALSIATSGTQGIPKIINISRQNIKTHCDSFIKKIPVCESSIWLNCMPLNHIAGVMIIYRCWFNHSSMLLHDNFDESRVWNDLQNLAISHISLVPRMLVRLLEHCHDTKPPASLKFVIVGGDVLTNELFQRAITAGWPIYISYGMTEATSTIALGKTSSKLIPLDGFEIEVNRTGILKIKGEMVVQSGWFETSDQVKWDGHYLSVLGRCDDTIISSGHNYSPQYLESILSVSPAVEDIAVGKINDKEWGDTIVALICGELNLFKNWLDSEIESSCKPRRFIKLDKIPRKEKRKIDRKAVQSYINKLS